MKYLLLIGDGMADYPIPDLEWKTPLETANTPNMDRLAQEKSILGMVRTIPKGVMPASDTAFLSILGCNPKDGHPGRGPLEAINLGINLKEGEVAFRVNLVTRDSGRMADYSAGHISDGEAAKLMAALNERFNPEGIFFYPGKSYRNVMVITKPPFDWRKIRTAAPHDISGRSVAENLPKEEKGPCDFLIRLMEDAGRILEIHPVNRTRIDLSENPANSIWLWGQGERANLPLFKERFGFDGVTVSAVDIVRGIGKAMGLQAPLVPGATGYLDTNYQGKIETTVSALKEVDFAILHIEAPDETSHSGEPKLKIKAINEFDLKIVGPAVSAAKSEFPELRIMIMADHITSLRTKTHTPDPVPFLITGSGVSGKGTDRFSEKTATATRLYLKEGWKILESFFKPTLP
ncbi:MAG: cofactor-independent phosphoglycerate mutase [Candidatus Omnitrophota bacterium]